jgi:hypothetical protein
MHRWNDEQEIELFGLLDDTGEGNDKALPLVNKQMAMTINGSVVGRERIPGDDDDDLLCSPLHRRRQERELLLPPLVQNNPISLIDLSGIIAIEVIMMFPSDIDCIGGRHIM